VDKGTLRNCVVGPDPRAWQRRSGVSASPGEPPAGAVPAGAYGPQVARTGANCFKNQILGGADGDVADVRAQLDPVVGVGAAG
jgi:hypothetical protein